jgi:hypothetical protein
MNAFDKIAKTAETKAKKSSIAILTEKHKLISLEALNYEPIKLQRIVEEY